MLHTFNKQGTFAFTHRNHMKTNRKTGLRCNKLTKTSYRRDSFVDYPEKSKLLRNALSTHIFLSNVLLINCI